MAPAIRPSPSRRTQITAGMRSRASASFSARCETQNSTSSSPSPASIEPLAHNLHPVPWHAANLAPPGPASLEQASLTAAFAFFTFFLARLELLRRSVLVVQLLQLRLRLGRACSPGRRRRRCCRRGGLAAGQAPWVEASVGQRSWEVSPKPSASASASSTAEMSRSDRPRSARRWPRSPGGEVVGEEGEGVVRRVAIWPHGIGGSRAQRRSCRPGGPRSGS